jgi:hypothetical protein
MPLRRCCVFPAVGIVAAFLAGAGFATAAEPPADLGEQPATLDDLAWMEGDWVAAQAGTEPPSGDESPQSLAAHIRWSPTRAFLIREMTIHRDDQQVAHYMQRIGHDARTNTLRSWLFDDEGSHGEAVWTKKGDTFIARSTTVLPDGREVTARTEYHYDGQDRCTLESTHTHDGGAGLPPVRLTLVRATAAVSATTDDDTDAFARKAAIMQSPRWQRAVSELGCWLATQTIYPPDEVLRIKAGFNDRVAHASPDEIGAMLDNLDAKLRIVESPEAREARDWVGHYLSAMSDQRRARAVAAVPDITTMSAAELQAEIKRVTQKRADIQQRQAAFESGRQELVQQARQAGQQPASPSGGRATAISPPHRDGEPPFANVHGPGMTIYTGGGFGGAGVAMSVGNF